MSTTDHDPIVVFDGECGFCSRSIRFFLEREREPRVRFASRHSTVGREVLDRRAPDLAQDDTIVLLERDGAWARSGAALRLAGRMRAPWPLLRIFLLVPYPIRDWIYDRVADRRHAITRNDPASCAFDPSLRDRFLDT